MRVNRVAKSRNDAGSCGKCGEKLPAGSAYVWIKFRRGGKRVRCTKAACQFRPSDLTTSDKKSRVYSAIESAEDQISTLDVPEVEEPKEGEEAAEPDHSELHEQVRSILEDCGGEIREVAEEYRESAENIRESFSESPTADECDEKADELESFADELESFDASSEDEAQAIVDAGIELLGSCPL